MAVEHYLTRELDIRFIDARTIATEARLNLGLHGYPTKAEEQEIREEAHRIFQSSRLEKDRSVMRELSSNLEAAKMPLTTSRTTSASRRSSTCSASTISSADCSDTESSSHGKQIASNRRNGRKQGKSLFSIGVR
jgi:hypothetical protein